MPTMNEKQLKTAISNGDIKPIYLLYGDDSYLVSHYEAMLCEKICGKDNDFDLQKFERDVDLQSVYDAVNQFPMLGGRKCVVLSDYPFDTASDGDFERLCALVSDSYEFSTLVLRFDAVTVDTKHSARAAKLVNLSEKAGGVVVELKHREASDVARMLVAGAKKRGVELNIDVARYMIENCGADINTLSRELDKLCLYVANGAVTVDDVDKVCVKTVDASVYEYVRKMIFCDMLGALNILNDLLYMRFEPILIIYSAASAFVDMVRVSSASKVQTPVEQLKEDFGYSNKSFVLDKARQNLKRFNDKKLSLCMNEILSADKQIKSFSIDEKTVLEQMTVRIVYIISNGEPVD